MSTQEDILPPADRNLGGGPFARWPLGLGFERSKPCMDRYRGKFDQGWDVVREQTLARQTTLGIVPQESKLPARNPGIKAWAELSLALRRSLHIHRLAARHRGGRAAGAPYQLIWRNGR
ncbi:hypothetical protein GCM10023165_44300 [Variovorax defluvii]|uniref:Uncharacterized protein n=1 Tax=Variovorax defluvii TaxID=913761 RepID=A0ABP8I9B6_9BURK